MLKRLRFSIVSSLMAALVIGGAMLVASEAFSLLNQDDNAQDATIALDLSIPAAAISGLSRRAKTAKLSASLRFFTLNRRGLSNPLRGFLPETGKDLLALIQVRRT
jgi:hypothetical protein